MNFHDVRIPEFISAYAHGSLVFDTYQVNTDSGRDLRYQNWEYPINKYSIENLRLSQDQFIELKDFFRARSGRLYSFRIKDHADFSINNQLMFILEKEFLITKEYPYNGGIAKRPISKPVRNSIHILDFQNCKMAARVNWNTGKVILDENISENKAIYFSCEFDVQVRFNKDVLDYKLHPDGWILIPSLEFIEVHS